MVTIYGVFSNKYLIQELYAAFSTLEKAVEALMRIPNKMIVEQRLTLCEINVDVTDANVHATKRINPDEPRVVDIIKKLAKQDG